MKKSDTTKHRLARHLALFFLSGAALFVVSSNALAENAEGKSSTNLAKVAALNFQERGRSGAKIPLSQALTYCGGVLLAGFLVRTHARVVLRKSARM